MLCAQGAAGVLRDFADVLAVPIPELTPMFGFPQHNPHHDKDVWDHTIAVIESITPEPVLRWAALLHDIGKRFIDHDIVRGGKAHRSEKEQEVYRSHPKIGAEYLRETCRFSADVYEGIMEHHECYNGEGYPLGKKGGEIHLFARIIRIADCYDAKVSAFPAQKSLSPSEALEYVMALGDRWFDPDIVAVFARKVAAYPIGCEVELSNGQHPVVARNFENFPLRPLVRVVETGEMLNMRDDEKARAVTVGRLIVR